MSAARLLSIWFGAGLLRPAPGTWGSLVAVLLGWLLDRWLGSFPAATAVLGLLGFAGGLRQLLREADRLEGGRRNPPGGPRGPGPGPGKAEG